jgi:hypothetical protein
MSPGFEQRLRIGARMFEATEWGLLSKEEAKAAAARYEPALLTRYYMYRTPPPERAPRWVVYTARPRCQAAPVADYLVY